LLSSLTIVDHNGLTKFDEIIDLQLINQRRRYTLKNKVVFASTGFSSGTNTIPPKVLHEKGF
jgi:hypothetical protein